jgi:Bromodomain
MQVSDSIAPGYSRLIKNPMYLQKIYEKIKAKAYGDMEDMSNDVTLMFENCIAFNNPTSNYGKVDKFYSSS